MGLLSNLSGRSSPCIHSGSGGASSGWSSWHSRLPSDRLACATRRRSVASRRLSQWSASSVQVTQESCPHFSAASSRPASRSHQVSRRRKTLQICGFVSCSKTAHRSPTKKGENRHFCATRVHRPAWESESAAGSSSIKILSFASHGGHRAHPGKLGARLNIWRQTRDRTLGRVSGMPVWGNKGGARP